MAHVYFINYGAFGGSSGIHIFHLANHLSERGWFCHAVVPGNPHSVYRAGTPLFEAEHFHPETVAFGIDALLKQGHEVLVHAWTPRERVRRLVTTIRARFDIPVIVHLEDNELLITEKYNATGNWIARASRGAARRAGLHHQGLTRPDMFHSFINEADGFTCITEKLLQYAPEDTPHLMFWPACEPEFFELAYEPDQHQRDRHEIPADAFVIVYPGNTHPANVEDMVALYRAVETLHAADPRVMLLRIGTDHPAFTSSVRWAGEAPWLRHLGAAESWQLPPVLAMANALVQPGGPDQFNDYRFPSKVPMFLASGRPVVLPRANIGHYLKSGTNCILLDTPGCDELVTALRQIMADPEKALGMGIAGREFAKARLNWNISTDRLDAFYRRILNAHKKTA